MRELQPRFRKLYAKTGRPSIAPEKLLASAPAASAVLGAQRTAVDGFRGLVGVMFEIAQSR